MKKLLVMLEILTVTSLYCPHPRDIFGASLYQNFDAANRAHNEEQLFFAVFIGDHNRVGDLLSLNVSPNSITATGQSALHLAVASNDIGILNLLLSSGANPNSSDRNGQTSLHYAVLLNTLGMVRRLLQCPHLHSLPFDQDNFGHTPLFYAQQLNAQEIQNAFQEHERRLLEVVHE